MPAISTVEMQKGGGMQSLAVPAGLFLLQQSLGVRDRGSGVRKWKSGAINDAKNYQKVVFPESEIYQEKNLI